MTNTATEPDYIFLSSPHMGQEEQRYVAEAFATNLIVPLGPNVDNFEAELAAIVGSKDAVAVNSGTAALHLALIALGVTKGDAVFTSSFTFIATATPILYQGAIPVFIDADLDTWNMSPVALQQAFAAANQQGKLPKAVIVASVYGQSADLAAIKEICDAYDVPMIEDAAEGLGATYRDKQCGTVGKIGIYSFNGNKIITTSGGGAIVSDDIELLKHCRFLATQAREPVPYYEHKELGFNYRMSNVLAGIGRGQLKVLAERVAQRRQVFANYVDQLKDIKGLQWMPEASYGTSTRWLSCCYFDPQELAAHKLTAAQIVAAMQQARIEARRLWKPLHLQPVFADVEFFAQPNVGGSDSVSEFLFANGICLPSGSNLTKVQQDRVVTTLLELFTAG